MATTPPRGSIAAETTAARVVMHIIAVTAIGPANAPLHAQSSCCWQCAQDELAAEPVGFRDAYSGGAACMLSRL
eukprot:2904059-Amphidinium_carterae.1